jgi:hypothetical protein
VVEAGVDQVQADDRSPGPLLDLGVRAALGTEARAREHQVADQGQVALALVDVGRRDDLAEAVRLQPGRVRGGLAGALGVGEPGADGGAVHDERAVGGEDHVRQAGDRLELEHLVPEGPVRVPQPLPLPHRERGVDDRAGGHPGVDGVLHAKCTGEHMRKRRRTATRSEDMGSGDSSSPGSTAVMPSTVRSPWRTCQGQPVLSDARVLRVNGQQAHIVACTMVPCAWMTSTSRSWST